MGSLNLYLATVQKDGYKGTYDIVACSINQALDVLQTKLPAGWDIYSIRVKGPFATYGNAPCIHPFSIDVEPASFEEAERIAHLLLEHHPWEYRFYSARYPVGERFTLQVYNEAGSAQLTEWGHDGRYPYVVKTKLILDK